MIYGGEQNGGATFTLSPEEHEQFKQGKAVIKRVGDCNGEATITLKMTRPRRLRDRFPVDVFGENYKRPKKGKVTSARIGRVS